MSKRKLIAVLSIITIVVAGILVYNFTKQTPEAYQVIGTPVPKGDRILSILITPFWGDRNYDKAFETAKSAGMQATPLMIDWGEFETSPMVYNNESFVAAKTYYLSKNVSVSLEIDPISTDFKTVPPDLADKSFDDPIVIERFNRLLDYVFSEIPELQLTSLCIGNEIDGYLGTNATRWGQYLAFYNATAAYAKTLRPGLKVGTQAGNLMGKAKEYLIEINQISDVIMLSYYPLNWDLTVKDPTVVDSDFDAMTSLYEDKPIFILECGYPSSEMLNSSERKQREFIRHVFMAWDEHASQILLINFFWLHDVGEQWVRAFEEYYGISYPNFLEWLGTMGLRTYEGKDKEAWVALKSEAEARGW